MMYPLDRRIVAQNIYSIVKSLRKTALLLKVSHMTISRWIKNPERLTYSMFSKARIISESIRSLIQNDPLVMLSQLQESIESTFAFKVSKELLRTIRKKQGFSRKKVKFFNKPSSMQEKLESFFSERDKLVSRGYHFVSLDFLWKKCWKGLWILSQR